MNTVILKKSSIYEGNLILVNGAHPLRGEEPDDLVPAAGRADMRLRRAAAGALQAALGAIAAGREIVPVSGYRSGAEQENICRESLRENGETFTRSYVALPGHSEHQTGLAIDLGLWSEHIDFIRPDFPYEGICQTFRRAAPSYGFVERYPAGKEAVTGIAHEPWHFRYVGAPHGEIMTERDMTLEEYMDFIQAYTPERPLVYQDAKVYFVPAAGAETAVPLPEGADYALSGNNIDGFVVTVWGKSR